MEKWQEEFAAAAFRRSSEIAHDLKTPLNVAVLNLELLRMRVRKLCGEDDAKVAEYTRSIEVELRRMGRIYDAYFVNAAPPRNGEAPQTVDLLAVLRAELSRVGFPAEGEERGPVTAHPSRLNEACRLLADGCAKTLSPTNVSVEQGVSSQSVKLRISGEAASSEIEIGKIFKFYYTDSSGSPDLSLSTARLIFETYGASFDVHEEGGRVVFELLVPIGER